MGPKPQRKSNGPMDKFVQPCGKQATSPESTKPLVKSQRLASKNPLENLMMFRDLTNGGKNIPEIIKKPSLDSTTFKTVLLNKSSPPESQSGSPDDAYIPQNECGSSENKENQDPQQIHSAEANNANEPPVKKLKLDVNTTPEELVSEIPDSKMMLHHRSSQFTKVVKGMKTQQGSGPSHIQDFFPVEYGKNTKIFHEEKRKSKLTERRNSVCQVRVNGGPAGSGFLFFGRFVLTNAHVIKSIYNEDIRRLDEKVTVHFFFESLNQTSGIDVEEVAAFEYCPDISGHTYDWALLQLSADQNLPDVLLKHFGFLPRSGEICIIGHLGGGVKGIGPCVIIPSEQRSQVVEKHYRENPDGVIPEGSQYSENQEQIQLLTSRFFEAVAESIKNMPQAVTYESCFYFGSSGSPVFDEHCNVVAMHSGGYAYRDKQNIMRSVIEFGYPLSVITEHLILQLVERGRLDVLQEYLACDYVRRDVMMTNLKKLVESRNLTAFKNAANKSEAMNNDELKTFFSFICQTEEPVPMDTD